MYKKKLYIMPLIRYSLGVNFNLWGTPLASSEIIDKIGHTRALNSVYRVSCWREDVYASLSWLDPIASK